jgi:predicted acyl esterase
MTHTISRPFEYSGFSEPQFDRYVRSSTYVEMSDGAKIAADLYLPDGYVGPGEAPTEFPVIVNFMPYLRALIDPVTGKAVPHILSRPGEQCGDYHKYGYALVIADTRTHGASTGPAALVFGWRYQQDAGELIDWIDRQDWCDGNVGHGRWLPSWVDTVGGCLAEAQSTEGNHAGSRATRWIHGSVFRRWHIHAELRGRC